MAKVLLCMWCEENQALSQQFQVVFKERVKARPARLLIPKAAKAGESACEQSAECVFFQEAS